MTARGSAADEGDAHAPYRRSMLPSWHARMRWLCRMLSHIDRDFAGKLPQTPGGLTTLSGSFQLDNVIWMLFPFRGSTLIWTSSWLLCSRIQTVPGTGPLTALCGAILFQSVGADPTRDRDVHAASAARTA